MSRFEVRARAAGGWVVVKGGVRISPIFTSRDRADAACERFRAREAMRREMVRRPCLCCGNPFISEGVHNRLCNLCRARGQEPGAFAASLPNRRGK